MQEIDLFATDIHVAYTSIARPLLEKKKKEKINTIKLATSCRLLTTRHEHNSQYPRIYMMSVMV